MKNVDVFILAAGLGKRLGGLSVSTPKPLVTVKGKALIDYHLERLIASGCGRVIINLHHLGEQIEQHVRERFGDQLELEFSQEPILLDTGGGIKNIEPLLRHQELLTINADTLLGSDFSFESLLSAHRQALPGVLATLTLKAVPDAKVYGELGIDARGQIGKFIGSENGLPIARRGLVYIGVQVLARKLFDRMPARGAVFSITRDIYTSEFTKGGILWSNLYDGYWTDVGTPERLEEANQNFPA